MYMLLYIGQESGGVDFRTLGNQTAARVLEEVSVLENWYLIEKRFVVAKKCFLPFMISCST